jgi:hypothetical protein
VTYKEYLSREGFVYNEKEGSWVIGLGWGKSIKVSHILKGLFEITKNSKIIFSDFVESMNEFKHLIEETKKE